MSTVRKPIHEQQTRTSFYAWFQTTELRTAFLTLIASLAAFVILFPVLWIIFSSFRDPENFLTLDVRETIPDRIYFTSYLLAFKRAGLLRWIGNSLVVAGSVTVLSLLISAPAAFALTRLRFRGNTASRSFVTISYAIPSITILVPIYILLVKVGLNNSFIGLILIHSTFTIPFAIWMLRDFFRSIPPDLEEAGFVDGASIFKVMIYIILPLSIPGLVAAGVYAFILSWNEFLFAFVIMSSEKAFTATVGIHAYFTGRNIVESLWAQLMAAATMVSLPSAILFGFFQRYLVAGFLGGAVKG